MAIEIKKASKNDVTRLLEWRLKFMSDTYNKKMDEDFRKYTLKHLENNMGTNSLFCYIAEDNNNIVSSVIMTVYNVMPKLHNSNGRVGYIFNVSTLEEYRGHGLANKLLKLSIEEARELDVKEIYLSAEPKAVKLYETLGFKIIDREMVMRFE